MTDKNISRTSKTKKVKKSEAETPVKTALSVATIREFLLEVQNEFKKIVWPEKKVTLGLTAFVIVLVFIISIYLGSVDLFLGKLVSFVLK